MTLDSKGYGQHAGARALGIRYKRDDRWLIPQACAGDVTAECYRICQRGCYPPDHRPTPPFRSQLRLDPSVYDEWRAKFVPKPAPAVNHPPGGLEEFFLG